MPLFEEKLINPLAIRFSQERIRPTFQDGRELDLAFSQIEATSCDIRASDGRQYATLLRAPFPPIEIIRWQPRRSEDGSPSSRGVHVLEPHWITFDNRRLQCLQRAAAAQWPKSTAALVLVLYDMPVEKSAIRKMEHASAGMSVNVGRFHDDNPFRWDWMAETRGCGDTQAVMRAIELVQADAQASLPDDLVDAPLAAIPRPLGGSPPRTASQLLELAARHERFANPENAAHDCPEPDSEESPLSTKSVTADQLLNEWMKPKAEFAPASPTPPAWPKVESTAGLPPWCATTGLLSPMAAPWGESLAAPPVPMTLPLSPWLHPLWQSQFTTPPGIGGGYPLAAHHQQWPYSVPTPPPPGLLPLPVPPGPLPRNVPAFPYPAAVTPTPPPQVVPKLYAHPEKGLASAASTPARKKVSASVAELFALAASEGSDPERSRPSKSAGQDLLSLLKNASPSPQHEQDLLSLLKQSSAGSQQEQDLLSLLKQSGNPQHEQTLLSLLRQQEGFGRSADSSVSRPTSSSSSTVHAHGNQAGRELLGLLKPEAVHQDLVRPNVCSDDRDRIALGIWDALGQAPRSVPS